MSAKHRLEASALCWRCDPKQFDFKTTDQLEELDEILGQKRALDAVEFAIGIRRDGYNAYAMGPAGVGKKTVVQRLLERKAAEEDAPSDWCYVHNFDQPRRPRALQLPHGRGAELQPADMERLVDDLRSAIPAALEMEEHHRRLEEIQQETNERQENALQSLAEQAEKEGLRLIRTPTGFAIAPSKGEKVISADEFAKLSEEDRKRIETAVEKLHERLQQMLKEFPRWHKEARDKIRELNRDTTRYAIEHSISELKAKYEDLSRSSEIPRRRRP